MNAIRKEVLPLSWSKGAAAGLVAVLCFHLAYLPYGLPALRICSVLYVVFLVQLARLGTRRQAFYTTLGIGMLCVGPQLHWFWNIFGPAAIPLWLILALWIALFVLLAHRVLRRFGPGWALLLIPFLWTGLEYFRSELYFLRFSWMNAGYPAANLPQLLPAWLGMYGIGFLAAAFGTLFLTVHIKQAAAFTAAVLLALLIAPSGSDSNASGTVRLTGIQLEFPNEKLLPRILNQMLEENPDAELIVLSEYTLEGPVPEALKEWCRANQKNLIVGGKDPLPDGNFYNTAFVIDPRGEIVFKQVKSVPIQFFKDGLPAPALQLWESPWGKIGICICYDLSYRRVTDRLVKLGAQMLIVPTMDVAFWGKRQHELHAMVAPVRAREYGIPIFRLASSGISQAIDANGRVVATAGYPGAGEIITAELCMASEGRVPLDGPFAMVAVGVTELTVIILTIALLREKSAAKQTGKIRQPMAVLVE